MLWSVGTWQFQFNQIEATASKSAKNRLRHRLRNCLRQPESASTRTYCTSAARKATFSPFTWGKDRPPDYLSTNGKRKIRTRARVEAIRRLWSEGQEVVRIIDSLHDHEPFKREGALINHWGLLKDGTGILTNKQRYAPAHSVDGVELRKYAQHGNNLPTDFRSRYLRLRLGPRNPVNRNSVYGKICAVIEQNPGISGEELVGLLSPRRAS